MNRHDLQDLERWAEGVTGPPPPLCLSAASREQLAALPAWELDATMEGAAAPACAPLRGAWPRWWWLFVVLSLLLASGPDPAPADLPRR